jgi:hypothetical protein
MNNIVQILKKAGLFLFGVLLIIWGYKVNAANIEEKAKTEEEKKNKETEQPVATPPANKDSIKTEPQKTSEVKKETAGQKAGNKQKEATQAAPKSATPTRK